MRKWLLFFGLALPFFGSSQNIDMQDLEKIRAGFVKDNYTVAMENALSANPITGLAWSRENEGTSDQYFTYKVNVSGITNQKSSGRCWLFTSLNIFRPMAMKHFIELGI
ncbi:MAG: C1 family peptidase [Draconibacterium sp.]